MRDTPGVVYLLHFDRWVGTPGKGGARHYLGWTHPGGLPARMARHQLPQTRVAVLRGLQRVGGGFVVARTWEGETPADEKRRKRNGHLGALCPICRGDPDYPEGA